MFANLSSSKVREAIVANKKLFLLALIGLGLSGVRIAAQEQLAAPTYEIPGDPPPQLAVPEDFGSGTRSPGPASELPIPDDSSSEGSLEPFADSVGSGGFAESVEEFALRDETCFAYEPALLESSGSWVRRGFWYSEVDVVISDRIWSKDGTVLMSQVVGSRLTPLGRTQLVTNALAINGGQFGAEAAPRLKLGRFLFRDGENRDHAVEFIIYGGGQWAQDGRLDASTVNSANTTSLSSPPTSTAFNRATSSQFDYTSRLNSFEMNYHVSTRMRKDRMELEPSGQWVRRAQPSMTRSLIAGVRYINLEEGLVWQAFGIPDANNDNNLETGLYNVRADNDMIGTHLGFSVAHERALWSIGFRLKGGIFLNRSDVDSSFSVTGDVTSGGSRIEEDNLTFLTDAAVIAKWHLRPNVSLRVGVEGLFLTSMALAPDQLDFAPVGTSARIAGGDVAFLGGLIGLETYW